MSQLIYKNLPVFSFKDTDEFYLWLLVNHKSLEGFWLRYYKKNSETKTIIHNDAVDVALCFGWVDGLINKYDEFSYVVRYTPRRPKSFCSKVNVEKIEKLTKLGLMQPAGLQQVEEAKRDGRWDNAYSGQSEMSFPEEFYNLLNTNSTAKEQFDLLNKSAKYSLYFKIATAIGKDKKYKAIEKCIQILVNNSLNKT